MNEAPLFVYSDGIIADQSYLEWLSEVKQRFKNSQIKAAVRVNTEMLSFYWSIGRDLVALKAEQRWGAGVVKQFALDMRNTFPEETGFSYTNVKYMKRWYLFYFQKLTKGHQVGDLLQPDRKSHQLDGFLEMPDIFGLVPWKHHVHIFSKCKTLDEALFYVNIVAKEGWSRSYLEDQVTAKLFSRQGAVANNFDKTLPMPHNDLAKELLKDPYNFGFLTMKERYDEQDLEDALVQNITRFLLELGQGFSFVGRQMELQMPNGQTFFPDLVFYHSAAQIRNHRTQSGEIHSRVCGQTKLLCYSRRRTPTRRRRQSIGRTCHLQVVRQDHCRMVAQRHSETSWRGNIPTKRGCGTHCKRN